MPCVERGEQVNPYFPALRLGFFRRTSLSKPPRARRPAAPFNNETTWVDARSYIAYDRADLGGLLRKGETLGNFELQGQIAVGGMAEVWSASDASGRRVALKILRLAGATPSMRSMWTDEVNLATRLRHPSIVRVEGAFEDRECRVQIMELVEGQDLRRVLQAAHKAKATMPLPIALTLTRDLARALGYAHSAKGVDGRPLGIVHRDVSPHNVMLTKEGRVKLLDFGIARANDRLTKTAAGVIKGKLSYMAPEQAIGAAVTVRTDVFALGIMLWESLAMRRLFKADNDAVLISMICEAQVPPIQSIRPEVPDGVAGLLRRMLALHPKERPETMRVVEDELTRVLVTELTPAQPLEVASWAALHLRDKRRTAQLPMDKTIEVPAEFEEDDETSADARELEGSDDVRGALMAPAVVSEGSAGTEPSPPVSSGSMKGTASGEARIVTSSLESARTEAVRVTGQGGLVAVAIPEQYPTLPFALSSADTEPEPSGVLAQPRLSAPTRASFDVSSAAIAPPPILSVEAKVTPVRIESAEAIAPARIPRAIEQSPGEPLWRWLLLVALAVASVAAASAAILR
ncbi:MAG: protein kinase [Deltaproteobacteria bacterium]|nr:protein kinase [Deltaproteobacteria bacterium]